MKKIMAAVLLSVVMLGGSVLNVAAVNDLCLHPQTASEVQPRPTSYSHEVEIMDSAGRLTLIGCTVTTVKNVRVTTCTTCGMVIREEVIAEYGPYHSVQHN